MTTKTKTDTPNVLALRRFPCNGHERGPGDAFHVADPKLVLKLVDGGYVREIAAADSTIEAHGADVSTRIRHGMIENRQPIVSERPPPEPEPGLPPLHPEFIQGFQDRVFGAAVVKHLEDQARRIETLEVLCAALVAQLEERSS